MFVLVWVSLACLTRFAPAWQEVDDADFRRYQL
jgi:hypothetical protein